MSYFGLCSFTTRSEARETYLTVVKFKNGYVWRDRRFHFVKPLRDS